MRKQERTRKSNIEVYLENAIEKGINFKRNPDKPVTGCEELYMFYPYKTMDPKSKCVYPYIKKEDRSDHKYTMNYKQWNEIYKVYTDIIIDELFTGNKMELPHRMGTLALQKVQFQKTYYKHFKSVSKRKKFETNQYHLLNKWDRRNAYMAFKGLWLFSIKRKTFLRECEKLDMFNIHHFNTYHR